MAFIGNKVRCRQENRASTRTLFAPLSFTFSQSLLCRFGPAQILRRSSNIAGFIVNSKMLQSNHRRIRTSIPIEPRCRCLRDSPLTALMNLVLGCLDPWQFPTPCRNSLGYIQSNFSGHSAMKKSILAPLCPSALGLGLGLDVLHIFH